MAAANIPPPTGELRQVIVIFPSEPQDLIAVSQHYDALDEFYLELWGEHIHHGLWLTGDENATTAVQQLVRHVARAARVKEGDRVCDVGCGYGATARMLARDYGALVTGITLSARQCEYATRFNRCSDAAPTENPNFVLGDWLKNALPGSAFDAVVAIESSEHVLDKQAFVAEICRVLRPGGRAVVCAWLACEAPPPCQVRHLLEPICREGRLPSMGSESDYRRLFRNAGLAIEEFQDLSRYVKKTWLLCMARLVKGIATNPRYRRFLFNRANPDRVFAKTVFRLWAAYRTGAMRYGSFTAVKPVFESGSGQTGY